MTFLEWPKSASAAEIKSAFRKLAKKYHPDQSKEPRAKERFAEVGSAYEILGDEKKRGAFDRGEIDAEGKPRAPQFEGFGFGRQPAAGGGFPRFRLRLRRGGFSAGGGSIDPDILSELFGSGRRGGRARPQASRGEDIAVTVAVPLATAAHGGSVRVALPTGKTLDATVPAGIEEGKSIRLRGQGHAGQRGGPAGDVIVTIRYAPHPLFKVEGRDLRLDLPITLYEAVLGGKVRVPTLGGEVEMSIAPGMSGGRVLGCAARACLRPRVERRGRLARDDPDRAARACGRGADRTDAQVARPQALRPAFRHRLSGRSDARSRPCGPL